MPERTNAVAEQYAAAVRSMPVCGRGVLSVLITCLMAACMACLDSMLNYSSQSGSKRELLG